MQLILSICFPFEINAPLSVAGSFTVTAWVWNTTQLPPRGATDGFVPEEI
jgi:hypothetical protein